MARIINFSIEVTDEEMKNFLYRMSGGDGRKVDVQADEAPEVEVDKNGVVWDARYHASSKALNADGTWRRRRGLSDAETAEAEAYEKGGETMTVSTADGSATVTVTDGSVTVEAEPFTMPGLPGLPTAPAPVSYEEVVKLYQAAMTKNPALDVQGLYAKAGVTDPNVLNTDAGAPFRIELAKLFREV